ncbi:MAG: cytochrome c peroxidase [Verrucomicrobiota bacterium]
MNAITLRLLCRACIALAILCFLISVIQLLANETTFTLTPNYEENQVHLDIVTGEHPDQICEVQISDNLEIWTTVSEIELQDGSGSTTIDNLSPSSGPVFYRVAFDDSTVELVLDLPDALYNYANPPLPDHLTANNVQNEDNTPDDNPVTDEGATLGRVLFYDKKLSLNETISCSSCHLQENGFSDPAQFSVGFEGGLTGRNSMGLANARFYEREHFFWDERADTLEDQVLMPIQDAVEMGLTLDVLVERLQVQTYYQVLFAQAFGDEQVTSERISLALSQFIRSMVSYRSKYDEGEQTNFANFTAAENRGRQLFNSNQTRCNDCHEGVNFVGDQIENNGLEFPFLDLGVGGDTGRQQDMGKFKMSSLRNIEVTAPYMHDGRFATLEEVIDHYSTEVVANPNLGNELEQPGPGDNPARPNFSPQATADLVAFLKTLTDHEFLTDPKFSDPFRE